MRNGSVYLKLLICLPALSIAIFFSSCQKTSTTSSSDTGDWAYSPEFQGARRTQAASFTIGDTVYVGGGYNLTSNSRLNDFWRFDEKNGWIRIADFTGPARQGAVGFSVNGKGYIGTGFDGNTTYYKDFYQYDPSSNTWNQIADFPGTARYAAVGFAVDGKGYVGTGFDSSDSKADFYSYDPTSGWAISQSLQSKRQGASTFVYNNLAYLVGGVNSNGLYLADLSVFNPNVGSWSRKRDINDFNDSSYDALYGSNITRSNAACFLINDTAYLATGNFNGITGTTWAYDITHDQWFVKTAFEGSARESAIGFSVNNHGYITTGDNASNYFDDTWQFFPNVAQTVNDNQP
jgi:N-acetylneuraminic acid mutarotase